MIRVKSVLSKWLLTAIVVLSFFTFSGLSIQVISRVTPPNITLVAGFVNRIPKSFSYGAALKAADRNNLSNLIFPLGSLLALSFLHSREAHVAVKQTVKLFMPGRLIKYFSFISPFCSDSSGDSDLLIG